MKKTKDSQPKKKKLRDLNQVQVDQNMSVEERQEKRKKKRSIRRRRIKVFILFLLLLAALIGGVYYVDKSGVLNI